MLALFVFYVLLTKAVVSMDVEEEVVGLLLLWWKIYLEHFLLTFPKSQLFQQSDDQENRQIRLPPQLLFKKKSQQLINDDDDEMMTVCSIQTDFAASFLPESGWKVPYTLTYKYNLASLPISICLHTTVPKLGNVPLPVSLVGS